MKYTKTITIKKHSDLNTVKVGQWVKLPNGERGQYLGATTPKTFTVRFQRGKFTKTDAVKNHAMRVASVAGVHL